MRISTIFNSCQVVLAILLACFTFGCAERPEKSLRQQNKERRNELFLEHIWNNSSWGGTNFFGKILVIVVVGAVCATLYFWIRDKLSGHPVKPKSQPPIP